MLRARQHTPHRRRTRLAHLRLAAPLAVAWLIAAPVASAQTAPDEAAWPLAMQADVLAADPVWRALLRYRPDGKLPARSPRVKSNVLDDDFFLAPEGRTDPLAELIATVRAFQGHDNPAPDASPHCRFPARAAFLRLRTGWPQRPSDLATSCPAYFDWTDGESVADVSLMFATGYFGNAGSVYGHLLVKFTADGSQDVGADLLNKTINYGAAEADSDPIPAYIVKGLFGGYRSRYTPLEFYQHTQRYREIELRDLWEYRLGLSSDEVELLVANVWELVGRQNRYYFLLQNCAYRIGELVDVVAAQSTLPGKKIWVTPQDIIQKLETGRTRSGTPLLENVQYFPSRYSAFRDGYFALSPQQRRFVDARISGRTGASQSASLSRDDTAEALNVLLDYETVAARQADEVDQEKIDALTIERLGYPVVPREQHRPPPHPHLAQKTSRLSLGPVINDNGDAGVELYVRPTNHDLLSPEIGILRDSELEMGGLRLQARAGDITLKELNIMRITSLNTQSRTVPGSGKAAWRVRVGAEAPTHRFDEDPIGLIEGGYGLGTVAGPLSLYALGAARINAFTSRLGAAEVGATIGAVARANGWAVRLESTYLRSVESGFGDRDLHTLELRLGESRRFDVRLRSEYRDQLQTTFFVSRYW